MIFCIKKYNVQNCLIAGIHYLGGFVPPYNPAEHYQLFQALTDINSQKISSENITAEVQSVSKVLSRVNIENYGFLTFNHSSFI